MNLSTEGVPDLEPVGFGPFVEGVGRGGRDIPAVD